MDSAEENLQQYYMNKAAVEFAQVIVYSIANGNPFPEDLLYNVQHLGEMAQELKNESSGQ